jgi:hypothetical protein
MRVCLSLSKTEPMRVSLSLSKTEPAEGIINRKEALPDPACAAWGRALLHTERRTRA